MSIQSQWRAWLCLAAVLGVIVFCACHSKARSEPSFIQSTMQTAPAM